MLKKIFLIFIILVNISSIEIPDLEFNKETNFDKDNKQFSINYEGEQTSLLVYLTQENKNISLLLSGKEEIIESYNFEYPGGGAVYLLSKDNINILNIESNGESELGKGTIWANPLTKEIEIDLSETYEQKFIVVTDHLYGKERKLNYSVSNLESDKTFTFYYNSTDENDYTHNPYNICHIEGENEDCNGYIGKYTFKKGNKYKICLKFLAEAIDDKKRYYMLPSYQFHEGTNLILDVENKIDKEHNNFLVGDLGIADNELAGILIYINQENKQSKFTIHVDSKIPGGRYNEYILNPGKGIFYFAFGEAEIVLFVKGVDEEEKGTIWVHPLNKEIEIDLSEKYEKKFAIRNRFGKDYGPLIYSVSNLKEDKNFNFTYESNYRDEEIELNDLRNPFKICNGEDCKEGITNYCFKKGEKYKIYVQFIEKPIKENKIEYFLPSFSFYQKDKKEDDEEKRKNNGFGLKLSFIPLLLLLVLF